MKKLIVIIIIMSFIHATMFLDQGIGIAGKQMGGAYTACPKGVSAVYWNMAAFAGSSSEIYFDYSSSFLDINKATALYGVTDGNDSLIVGAYRVDAGQVITMVTSTSDPKNVNYSDTAYFFGYSSKINEQSSLGLTLKLIQQSFTTVKNSYALDLSYYLKSSQDLHFGVVVENIYLSSSEDKPIIRAGIKYSLGKLDLNVDTKYYSAFSKAYFSVGSSYRMVGGLYVKAGYNSYDEKIFIGTSLDLNKYRVDYIFQDSDLGSTHQVGMSISL